MELWKGLGLVSHWKPNVSVSPQSRTLRSRSHPCSDPYCHWPILSLTHTVSDPYCQWAILSLTHTVTDPYCQWPILSVTHTVTDPYCQWPILSVTHTVTDPYCQWPILSVTHTVTDPYCYWPILSVTHTVSDPYCQWPILLLTHTVSDPYCHWPILSVTHTVTDPYCHWPILYFLRQWPILSLTHTVSDPYCHWPILSVTHTVSEVRGAESSYSTLSLTDTLTVKNPELRQACNESKTFALTEEKCRYKLDSKNRKSVACWGKTKMSTLKQYLQKMEVSEIEQDQGHVWKHKQNNRTSIFEVQADSLWYWNTDWLEWWQNGKGYGKTLYCASDNVSDAIHLQYDVSHLTAVLSGEWCWDKIPWCGT